MGIAYRLNEDAARQVGEFLANNLSLDGEAAHSVAAALLSLANGDGPIVLADETAGEEPGHVEA